MVQHTQQCFNKYWLSNFPFGNCWCGFERGEYKSFILLSRAQKLCHCMIVPSSLGKACMGIRLFLTHICSPLSIPCLSGYHYRSLGHPNQRDLDPSPSLHPNICLVHSLHIFRSFPLLSCNVWALCLSEDHLSPKGPHCCLSSSLCSFSKKNLETDFMICPHSDHVTVAQCLSPLVTASSFIALFEMNSKPGTPGPLLSDLPSPPTLFCFHPLALSVLLQPY